MNIERLFTYIGIGAIVLLLFGLAGWYVFISQKTQSVEDASSARGFSIGIPSFIGGRGSTAANAQSPETTGFGTEQVSEEGDTTSRRAPRLWHVNVTPVAGMAFVASSSKLRYIERATGHLFEADPATGDVRRITNTLIPKVYEAVFGNNVVLMRTDDEVPTTLIGTVGTTSNDGAYDLRIRDLRVNAGSIAARADAEEVYFMSEMQDSQRILRTSWNSTSTRQLLSVPAGDFMVITTSASKLFLLDRPASGYPGTLFSVGASLTPVIRNVPGLTALPHPSKNAYLYASEDQNGVRTFAKIEGVNAKELPISTVADKCVWEENDVSAYCAVPKTRPGSGFLNAWYRGEIHTDDTWYSVNPGSNSSDKLFTMSSEAGIDVENAHIDDAGEYIAFINGRDKSLWILRIRE